MLERRDSGAEGNEVRRIVAADGNVPSPEDTMEVVKRLEELTNEMKKLGEQLSELARKESAPRTNQPTMRRVHRAAH